MPIAHNIKRTRRIRTLLFSTLFPSEVRPRHGIFVETRLRHLLANGEIETCVVAPVPWFPSKHARFGEWATCAATPTAEQRGAVRVLHPRYPLPPKVGMNIAPLALALGARRTVANLLRSGYDFDVIDAHYYYPDGAAAALLAGWFKKPFVVTARGSDLNLLPNFAIPRRWIRWTAAKAAASLTVSGALGNRLVELGADPNKVHVAPNGVDHERFHPRDRATCLAKLGLEPERWLLCVGNLVASKGQKTVIEALPRLPGDVRLAIIGDGEDRSHLNSVVEELGLSHRVKFVSTVPQAELVDWYNAGQVLVLCSQREGMPNVVLEALACGTPVVATDVGGIPEILSSDRAGRLLDERTPTAIAAAVLEVLDANMSKDQVRHEISAFSWDETTRIQLDLFRSLARKH